MWGNRQRIGDLETRAGDLSKRILELEFPGNWFEKMMREREFIQRLDDLEKRMDRKEAKKKSKQEEATDPKPKSVVEEIYELLKAYGPESGIAAAMREAVGHIKVAGDMEYESNQRLFAGIHRDSLRAILAFLTLDKKGK